MFASRHYLRALLDRYRVIEAATKVEAVVEAVDQHERGRSAFETSLAAALERYRNHLDAQVAARSGAGGVRVGLATGTRVMAWATVQLWLKYLISQGLDRMTTGNVENEHLAGWVRWLATQPGPKGHRTAATVAKHCRHLKAAIRWVDAQRPRLLRDTPHLLAGLKPPRQTAPAPEAIKAEHLRMFLREAIRREEVGTAPVRRTKGSKGKIEEYEQGVPLPDTPVSRVFLLLAALGCRRSEALTLQWSDVDFEAGVVTIRSQKTGMVRYLPLSDRYQGAVAPEMLPLLRRWQLEAGGRPWVLPSRSGVAPTYSRQGWRTLEATLDVKVNPQRLRRSWVSYACACGLSPPFAALLAGHSPAVASRWYLGVVLKRSRGSSMLAAMGLAGIVAKMVDREAAVSAAS